MTCEYREKLLGKLRSMKDISVMDVKPETVKELSEIKINKELTTEKRVMSLIEQSGNPYVYRDGGVLVKVSFADRGKTLQSCMEEYLTAEILLNH